MIIFDAFFFRCRARLAGVAVVRAGFLVLFKYQVRKLMLILREGAGGVEWIGSEL